MSEITCPHCKEILSIKVDMNYTGVRVSVQCGYCRIKRCREFPLDGIIFTRLAVNRVKEVIDELGDCVPNHELYRWGL